MSTKEMKEIVRRVAYDTYSGDEDVEVIDELVSDDFTMHEEPPLSDEDVRGPDGLKAHVEVARRTFPDLEYTIDRMIAEDDVVAVHFTVRGTHEGPLPGLDLEPTGEEIEFTGMEFDRIEDGELVESWLVTDAVGFLDQLGALPAEDAPTA